MAQRAVFNAIQRAERYIQCAVVEAGHLSGRDTNEGFLVTLAVLVRDELDGNVFASLEGPPRLDEDV